MGEVVIESEPNSFSAVLPALFVVTAVAFAAVSIFVFGLIVGRRMAFGLPPIAEIKMFSRKEAPKEPSKLPKVSG